MIKPALIQWARERANLSLEEASHKISSKKYRQWETGEAQPTLNQIEKIAQKFYVSLGDLFLSEPPEEKLPIPDFRTIDNDELSKPSINLLETIYDAQRKQNWLREQKIKDEQNKIIAEKSYTETKIIQNIKMLLEIKTARNAAKTYETFLGTLIEKLDEKEFLIIRNGVVGNNTHRSLDREEFKGFALFDEYAPVIFINGKDYKPSQIFTLVHELVHLFLRESALDGKYNLQTEKQCNRIAAEILLPEEEVKKNLHNLNNIEKVANQFKVSVFVVLIKARQLNLVNERDFKDKWQQACEEAIKKKPTSSTGGDFYSNVKYRAGGEKFLFRVANSTMAGETLYRDAYSLTGLRGKTFNKYYSKFGLSI